MWWITSARGSIPLAAKKLNAAYGLEDYADAKQALNALHRKSGPSSVFRWPLSIPSARAWSKPSARFWIRRFNGGNCAFATAPRMKSGSTNIWTGWRGRIHEFGWFVRKRQIG